MEKEQEQNQEDKQNQKLEELYTVKRMHIIVNPFAGKKKGKEISSLIAADFKESKIKRPKTNITIA